MKLWNKISKAIALCREVNIWQTLHLYYSQPHDRSAQLHVCNRSQIYLAPSAKIELKPKAILEFNMMEDPFKDARPSRLILHENSRLICKGHVQSFESVRIECLPNAIVEIGHNSYINHDSEIRCRERVTIGDNVSIAYNVLIQDSDYHTIYDEAGNPKQETIPITIGNDVWIGAGATILKGVTIGEGCVVAARSVVTRNTPPYSLVVGSPAKVIKQNIRHK